MKPEKCLSLNCTNFRKGKKYCSKHLWRLREYGTLVLASQKEKLTTRIYELEDGCWVISNKPERNGYVRYGKKNLHRIMYELFVGEIPDGFNVCHSCDFRPCGNPDHLFLGSDKDNMVDCFKKRRHPITKFKKTDIESIKSMFSVGTKVKDIAGAYAVSKTTIFEILKERRFKYWSNQSA